MDIATKCQTHNAQRLIDVNALKKERGMTRNEPNHDRDWIVGCIKHDGFIKTDRGDKANHIILEALEADTVEVVRCKDCRWYDNRYGDVCHNPRYGDGYANYPPPYVDEDYWCKDGEHKGGDEE